MSDAQLEVVAERMVAGGDALARADDGRIVFVRDALPGERVRAEIVEEHRDFARAGLLEVLDPHPDRTEPPCPHVARGCGGCGWQHLKPHLQRRLKREIVADSLRRLGRVSDPVIDEGPLLATEGFRTTLRLALSGNRLGFRRQASDEVVPVDSCLVAHPRLASLLDESRFPGAEGVILRASVATGERMAVITPGVGQAVLPADVRAVGADELAAGRRAWIHEEIGGQRLRISARSFFQSRADGAEALVAAVRDAAGEHLGRGRLVDAYSGVGLLAATLPAGGAVTAVERSASAVADARINLAGRGRVVRADVARWRPRSAAVVVADPARAGLGAKAVAALAATRAVRIVLVSCDAAALGRDAGLLRGAGYALERSTLLDLFPHTPHVEVVSAFTRASAPHGTGGWAVPGEASCL